MIHIVKIATICLLTKKNLVGTVNSAHVVAVTSNIKTLLI